VIAGTRTLFGDSVRELRLIAGCWSIQIKRSRDDGQVQEILLFLFKYTDTISSTESVVQSSTQTETEKTASTNRSRTVQSTTNRTSTCSGLQYNKEIKRFIQTFKNVSCF